MQLRFAVVLSALIGLVAAGCAPALAAPPRLVAAWPVSGASLPVAAHTLSLTFNRPLQPSASWASVWRDEDGMPMPTAISVEPGNSRRLLIKLLKPAAGAFHLHWHAVSASSRTPTAADGESRFWLHAEAPGAPHLDVSPSLADSGDRIEIDGRGFAPRSEIALTIGDDDQPLTGVTSDGRGSFSTELHVPAGVPFGEQRITGVDSAGGTGQGALQVRWGGWPPLVAFSVGRPGPDPGEVTFAISVRNRSDYVLESVRVIVSQPEGATLVAAEPPPTLQDDGLTWTIPMLDRGVVGPMYVTFRTTQAIATHATIEFRHRRPRGCSGDECLTAFVSETTSDSTPVGPAD